MTAILFGLGVAFLAFGVPVWANQIVATFRTAEGDLGAYCVGVAATGIGAGLLAVVV